MLQARRQRRRRRARHGDRADRRRAVQQRPRQRSLRHRLGRARARRPQRVGPRAGRGRRRRASPAGTQMPRRGWEAVTIPGAVSGWVALSQRFGALPFADLFAAGDPLRARRLPGVAGRRRQVGGGGAARCRTTWASPSTSCRAAARRCPARLFACPADGRDAREDRGDARRRVLPRRARRSDGRARARPRRAAHAGGLRRARGRLGRRRSRWTIAAAPCTRSRPTARASPR